MIVSTFFFYLFSAVMIASAVMVIGARNPVHSVLFLILAFVNAAGLFVLLGAEFLAMILVVVYVWICPPRRCRASSAPARRDASQKAAGHSSRSGSPQPDP
jgi:hypothetical protein